jgi:hypothetical protein
VRCWQVLVLLVPGAQIAEYACGLVCRVHIKQQQSHLLRQITQMKPVAALFCLFF